MSTLASPIAFARAQAQTDSNGLTDANAIVFANEALVDFRRQLIANSIDAAQVQEAYTDATVNVGTYLYPTNPAMLFLKAIELNYTSTNAQDYVTAQQIDASNIPDGQSFSWLRANASATTPYFDDRGDWYEIFPTPTAANNLTSTIRVLYFVQPTLYTATSDTVSYPESIDYTILGFRIAADYCRSLRDWDGAEGFDVQYDKRVKDLIATLGRGTQQPIQAQVLNVGNNGWQF